MLGSIDGAMQTRIKETNSARYKVISNQFRLSFLINGIFVKHGIFIVFGLKK